MSKSNFLPEGWVFYDSEIRWPEQGNKDLMIGFWNAETKVQGDITISWEPLGDILNPQLHVFEDSWKALYLYGQEFLRLLALVDNQAICKDDLKIRLTEIGFHDESLDEED